MRKFNHTGHCDDVYICGYLGLFFRKSFLLFLVIYLNEMRVSYVILDRENTYCFSR